jgi:DNA-binding response OmpR family regulator
MHEASLLDALSRAVHRGEAPSRILIVEDDPHLAAVLEASFGRHRIETCVAHSGTEAIRLAQEVEPDLLVLDLGLPDCDGFEVVGWMRRHAELRATPLLIYTARDLSGPDRNRLTLDGPISFATKGRVPPEALEARVLDLLGTVTTRHSEVSRVA